MSRETAEQQAASDTPGRPGARTLLRDAGVIAAWFLLAGVLGALIWWQVTDLPLVARDGSDAVLPPGELVKQVGIDGWFAAIALVGGAVSGAVLVTWRRRDPLVAVALVTVGAGLAALLMVGLGLLLGPGSVTEALKEVPDGGRVSMQLRLHAPGVAWLWPAAAAFGALVRLWVGPNPDDETG